MKLRALAVAIFILIVQAAGFTQTFYRMKQLANLDLHFVGTEAGPGFSCAPSLL